MVKHRKPTSLKLIKTCRQYCLWAFSEQIVILSEHKGINFLIIQKTIRRYNFRWNSPCFYSKVLLSRHMTKPKKKMTCAPSEDSDQPGHPPSLIRVFAVGMKKHWPLATYWAHRKTLIRLGWPESSLDAHVILLVLSCGGSITVCPNVFVFDVLFALFRIALWPSAVKVLSSWHSA